MCFILLTEDKDSYYPYSAFQRDIPVYEIIGSWRGLTCESVIKAAVKLISHYTHPINALMFSRYYLMHNSFSCDFARLTTNMLFLVANVVAEMLEIYIKEWLPLVCGFIDLFMFWIGAHLQFDVANQFCLFKRVYQSQPFKGDGLMRVVYTISFCHFGCCII